MEQSSIGMNGGQEGISSPGLTSSTVTTNPSVQTEAVNERSFKQSELNDLIGRAKRDAVESYRRQQTQSEPRYSDAPAQQPVTQQYQGNLSNEDHVRKIASEEAQRMREIWQNESRQKQETDNAQRIVNTFWTKVATGKEKYSDFDKVTGDIELGRFPNTVQILAEHLDNSADVLYELGKDRFKMAQLESLSYMSPNDAIKQAQRLAQSIKDNETAAKIRLPNEPLSQLRPSVSGTDNGGTSHRDLRAKYRT